MASAVAVECIKHYKTYSESTDGWRELGHGAYVQQEKKITPTGKMTNFLESKWYSFSNLSKQISVS